MSTQIWNPHAAPETPKTLELRNPVYEMFPVELTDLHREIQHHPALLQILHDQADKDVYIQIMEIASYCKILVTGTYSRDDMLNLCKMLTEKLMSMRVIIVIPPTI